MRHNKHGRISRRKFIEWSSLVAGWSTLPHPSAILNLAACPSSLPGPQPTSVPAATWVENGGFRHQDRGWQLGQGCRIVSEADAPSPQILQVQSEGTSTARAIILSPIPGRKYTVRGFMRTNAVKPLEPDGAALMTLNQFEFQGRPEGARDFAKLAGTHGWTSFSYTFECHSLVVWLELSLGLYRAEGEASFAGITLVEGSEEADVSQAIFYEEEPGIPTPRRSALANVAIFRDQIPVEGTASDPESLGTILKRAGYHVAYLTADQLADSTELSRQRYDILALPYGASFPAPAQPALVTFLRQGGSFFSTGGYAFNNPLLKSHNRWISEAEALAADPGMELIQDGDFEGSMSECQSAGWKIRNPEQCSLASDQAHQGRQCARVTTGRDAWWKDASWEYAVSGMKDRDRFLFTCWAKTAGVSDRYDGFAYINLEQLDASRQPIYVVKSEVVHLRGTTGWQKYHRQTVTNPETRWVRVSFGLSNASGTLWVDQVSLRKKFPEIRINTAKGFPNDELRVTPAQIGAFDADYRLRRVSRVETAAGQEVVKTSFHAAVAASGYAASGVLGPDHARWIPLLNAYDGFGRLRGAAGALMRHYNGFYRKSHWAFFGVSNADLFSAQNPSARALLLEVFDSLRRKTFLHTAQTDYASYRQGESVRISSWVSNFSSHDRQVSVLISVLAEPGRRLAFHHAQEIKLPADHTAPAGVTWTPGHFGSARYTVSLELEDSGRIIDRVETSFLVWDESVIRQGFPLEYRDNYLRHKERAVFLQGSDDYIHTFINRFENPGTWRRDISKYRDHALSVYENLMGSRGVDNVPPEAWWRQIDAVLQICQECKVVFFPGLLIFSDTAVQDSGLRSQQEFCNAFARRYHLSPGLIYYLNGDLRLRNPNLPGLRKIFNQYLEKKYGNERRLAEVWRVSPPEQHLGSIPPTGGTEQWDDVRAFDNFRFRVEVVRRWLDSMAAAIRQVDSSHAITAEFYQAPAGGIDVVTAIGSLTLANIGCFNAPGEDVYLFPQTFRFIDLRARDKSINDGEFGVKTHPAWEDAGGYLTTRSEAEEHQLYLAIPHYAVGMGGSKVQNWCWKYPADLPFEWGLNYPCDLVSRDALLYYRNTGLFFRQFDLCYESPEVFFLIADNHRMGGQGETVREAQLNAIRFLIDLHCPFGALDENHLESLPASCKTLIYPLPFCPSDATVERVRAFVERGGALYISGDISYDPERRRTKTSRLAGLLGVEFAGQNYPNIQFQGHEAAITSKGSLPGLEDYHGYPCIRVKAVEAEVMAATEDGTPVIVTHRLGRGRIFYSTDVLELHAPARTTDLGRIVYGSFLDWAGAERLSIEPDNPRVHLFRTKTQPGEEIYVIVNRDESAPEQQAGLQTGAGAVKLGVARYMTGALALTPDHAIQSIEISSRAEVNGQRLCETDLHAMLFSLDRRDLRDSELLCVLPMGQGTLRLFRRFSAALPVFESGEFREGEWVRLERGPVRRENGWLALDVTEDRNLSIILIATQEDMPRAVEQITRLMNLSNSSG